MASALQRLFAARKAKQAAKKQRRQQDAVPDYAWQDEVMRTTAGQSIPNTDIPPGLQGRAAAEIPPPAPSPLLTTKSLNGPQSQRTSLDAASLLSGSSSRGARSPRAGGMPGAARGREGSRSTPEDEDEDSEDDEPTSSPVYRRLCELQDHLGRATLVVVPSKRAYAMAGAQLQDLLEDQSWLSLAAFAPSRLFKDHFQSLVVDNSGVSPWKDVSVDLHFNATGEAHFLVKTVAGKRQWEKSLSILAETSIYRSTPKELRRHTTSFEVTSRAAQPASRKLSLVVVDGVIALPGDLASGQEEAAPSAARIVVSPPPPRGDDSNDEEQATLSSARNFYRDALLLVDPPPTLRPLSEALRTAFDTIASSTREWAATYVLVPQFDEYNRHKLRDGIFRRAWDGFARDAGDSLQLLAAQERRNLMLVMENVMLGFAHEKVFPSMQSVEGAEAEEDQLALVLATYRASGVKLEDLGVANAALLKRPARLQSAVNQLSVWQKGSKDADAEIEATSWQLRSLFRDGEADLDELHKLATPSQSQHASYDYELDLGLPSPRRQVPDEQGPSAFTPLDILTVLRSTIDACMSAATRSRGTRTPMSSSTSSLLHSPVLSPQRSDPPLSTDDLLPVLAFVLIRASPSLFSIRLRYARSLGLSELVDADQDWVLVTFEAVVRWLREDPLGLTKERGKWSGTLKVKGKEASLMRSFSSSSRGEAQLASPAPEQVSTRDRMRRLSLPATALLGGGANSVDGEDSSSASLFKLPGIPASATLAAAGSPPLGSSALSRTSSVRSGISSTSAQEARRGELVIRPQIVTRASAGSYRSAGNARSDGEASPALVATGMAASPSSPPLPSVDSLRPRRLGARDDGEAAARLPGAGASASRSSSPTRAGGADMVRVRSEDGSGRASPLHPASLKYQARRRSFGSASVLMAGTASPPAPTSTDGPSAQSHDVQQERTPTATTSGQGLASSSSWLPWVSSQWQALAYTTNAASSSTSLPPPTRPVSPPRAFVSPPTPQAQQPAGSSPAVTAPAVSAPSQTVEAMAANPAGPTPSADSAVAHRAVSSPTQPFPMSNSSPPLEQAPTFSGPRSSSDSPPRPQLPKITTLPSALAALASASSAVTSSSTSPSSALAFPSAVPSSAVTFATITEGGEQQQPSRHRRLRTRSRLLSNPGGGITILPPRKVSGSGAGSAAAAAAGQSPPRDASDSSSTSPLVPSASSTLLNIEEASGVLSRPEGRATSLAAAAAAGGGSPERRRRGRS